jgi:topoisomerase-4 subunit A
LLASIEDAVRKGKLKIRSVNDFTSEDVEIEIKAPQGRERREAGGRAVCVYGLRDDDQQPDRRDPGQPAGRDDGVGGSCGENTAKLLKDLKRELELKEKKLEQELHYKTLVRIFIENRIYKKIEQCRTNEAVTQAVHDGFRPFRKEMYRELTNEDVEMLLGVASAASRSSTSTSTAKRWTR